MDERTGDEYIGKPPPEPYPEDLTRRHRLRTDYTDAGAMRTRGGEWVGITDSEEDGGEESGSCRPSAVEP
jgi:hypothetical protein